MDSTPLFASGYDAALERLAALQALDSDPAIRADSGTVALLHGSATARAVVLLHGLTNGPLQFLALGELLHQAGYNVLIPRLPKHGYSDRLTPAIANLTISELAATADEALGIAAGLGQQICLVGLSLGGALAGWQAQQHSEVAMALLIAPLLGIQLIPDRLTAVMRRLIQHLPNRFVWWDPRVRDAITGPSHAYPRFATRALAAALWFGVDLLGRARQAKPAAPRLAMVTSWGDRAVNAAANQALVQRWNAHGADVATYRFGPNELPDLLHDMIDPSQPDQRTATVYPVLLRLLDHPVDSRPIPASKGGSA